MFADVSNALINIGSPIRRVVLVRSLPVFGEVWIDLIVELLCLIINPIDNKTEN